MATQYEFGAHHPDWEVDLRRAGRIVSFEELGLKVSDEIGENAVDGKTLIGLRGVFKILKNQGVL